MKIKPPIRTQDAQGSGEFGAPRGNHKHRGVDYSCYPGSSVYPVMPGKVTKLGKPYNDNPKTPDINELEAYDYVEVSDENGYRWRYFYVEPEVQKGQLVNTNTVLGKSQKLHYKGITQHCHLEIIHNGEYINPENIIT